MSQLSTIHGSPSESWPEFDQWRTPLWTSSGGFDRKGPKNALPWQLDDEAVSITTAVDSEETHSVNEFDSTPSEVGWVESSCHNLNPLSGCAPAPQLVPSPAKLLQSSFQEPIQPHMQSSVIFDQAQHCSTDQPYSCHCGSIYPSMTSKFAHHAGELTSTLATATGTEHTSRSGNTDPRRPCKKTRHRCNQLMVVLTQFYSQDKATLSNIIWKLASQSSYLRGLCIKHGISPPAKDACQDILFCEMPQGIQEIWLKIVGSTNMYPCSSLQ